MSFYKLSCVWADALPEELSSVREDHKVLMPSSYKFEQSHYKSEQETYHVEIPPAIEKRHFGVLFTKELYLAFVV